MAMRKSSRKGQRGEKTEKAVAVSAAPTQIKQAVAGIDVGSEHHYVAVPVGRDPEPVRRFGSFA